MRKFYILFRAKCAVTSTRPSPTSFSFFSCSLSGVDFYFQISFMNQRPVGYSVQEAFFNSVFFWFAFVLIFPLMTMRLFAEEFKLGTIEPLMTAPVRDWQVVLAKFFGALFFYVGPLDPDRPLLPHFPIHHPSIAGRLGRRATGAPI